MVEKNIIETPQDEEYLKKASIISLKIDKALEDNDADTATKLGNLFSKYMADMKQRAVDRKGGDGKDDEKEFHNFSSVFADIERDNFIPPWEENAKIHGLKQDILDKTIMYILNFTLRLNKAEKLTEPPSDTPKAKCHEIDRRAKIADNYELSPEDEENGLGDGDDE